MDGLEKIDLICRKAKSLKLSPEVIEIIKEDETHNILVSKKDFEQRFKELVRYSENVNKLEK